MTGLPVIVLTTIGILGCSAGPVRAGDGDAGACQHAHAGAKPAAWPLWEAYKREFIAPDGRVMDHLAKHSTSEGQAYAMFHALVARDEATFRKVLGWAERHLARGDLGRTLPAWRWADGKVTDKNPASDADLWMAYALVHAASAFGDDRLAAKGGRLLALIEAREVEDLPGLGPMMLPGPVGFALPGGKWRLNPSYLPIQLLRWAARTDPDGPWGGIVESTLRLADAGTPGRVWPDWIAWNGSAFEPDPVSGAIGSYDAIRAYLWPALLHADDPARGALLARGTRLLEATRALGLTPDRMDTRKVADLAEAVLSPNSPVGFRAIASVYARALGDDTTADALARGIAAERRDSGLYGEPAFYYDQNLLLFATGFVEGRYRFRADGGLELISPPTDPACTPP
ncbi:MAG: cellulase [Deltaproteobacteria bacterium]|nr:cellulase [Deltaproteobacteria bacterium]